MVYNQIYKLTTSGSKGVAMGKTFVNVLMNERLARALDMIASARELNRSDIVREAVREYLDRHNLVEFSLDTLPGPQESLPVPVLTLKPQVEYVRLVGDEGNGDAE
jgi:hypothetical protein